MDSWSKALQSLPPRRTSSEEYGWTAKAEIGGTRTTVRSPLTRDRISSVLPDESRHPDLPAATFTKYAHHSVDWIAQYLEKMDDYPVMARAKPGDVKSNLPKFAPNEPEPFENILADFYQVILPGITHWNHPRFFAYFSVTGSYAGIIGEMLCSALNVNAMLWKTSPSATELEEVVLDWLREMVGLPNQFEGVINDSASVGSLCALAK